MCLSFSTLHLVYSSLLRACFRDSHTHVGFCQSYLAVREKGGGVRREKTTTMRLTAVTRNFNKLLDQKSLKTLDHFAQFNPSPLTMQQFIDFGRSATEEESFSFLKKELPVRLSNIMKEINLLPRNLLEMPSVLILQVLWIRKKRDQCQFPISGLVQSKLPRCDSVRAERPEQRNLVAFLSNTQDYAGQAHQCGADNGSGEQLNINFTFYSRLFFSICLAGSPRAARVSQGGQPDGHGHPVLPRPVLHVPHLHADANPPAHPPFRTRRWSQYKQVQHCLL